jgi:hypothetical protein
VDDGLTCNCTNPASVDGHKGRLLILLQAYRCVLLATVSGSGARQLAYTHSTFFCLPLASPGLAGGAVGAAAYCGPLAAPLSSHSGSEQVAASDVVPTEHQGQLKTRQRHMISAGGAGGWYHVSSTLCCVRCPALNGHLRLWLVGA